jgi:hypothetical protein
MRSLFETSLLKQPVLINQSEVSIIPSMEPDQVDADRTPRLVRTICNSPAPNTAAASRSAAPAPCIWMGALFVPA